jgi:DNA-binding MarR family transcriptional regulator
MIDQKNSNMLKGLAGDCLCVRIRVLNRIITSVYDDALRPLGIRASQMNILVAVSAYGPATADQVCRVLYMDPSTLSRNVTRMKNRGWLETALPNDGKTRLIKPTQGGLTILERAHPAWQAAQKKAASILGDHAVEAISASANRLLLDGMSGA